MLELGTDQYESVRYLFQELDYSLSIQAAIEGNNPGRIFVDEVDYPRTALGNSPQAIKYLNKAVDHSWDHAERTSQGEKSCSRGGFNLDITKIIVN